MVTAKFDSRKRVVIPQAVPGALVAIETDARGIITLTPIKKSEPPAGKVKFIKKNGFTVGQPDRPITSEQVRNLMNDLS